MMLGTFENNKGSFYLSGGMQFAKDLGSEWRTATSIKLTQMGYFPLDITELDKQYQKQYGDLFKYQGSEELSDMQRKAHLRKHFIHADTELIVNNSDALIVYYDESARRGAGTISECQIAYMYDIPVFLVSAWEDWKNEVPGWLFGLTTKLFTNFNDLYSYLERLPPGILKKDMYGNRHSCDSYLCSLTGEPFKKSKSHFVSKISPLYSKESVELIKETYENNKDRYEFFLEQLKNQH